MSTEQKQASPRAWRWPPLIALSVVAVTDVVASLLAFTGDWSLLAVLLVPSLAGAAAAVGPRERPRWARAAAAAIGLPLVLLVMMAGAVAEGGVVVFALLGGLLVLAPFALLWARLGPALARRLDPQVAAAPARRYALGAYLVILGSVWLLARAQGASSVVVAPALAVAAGVGLLLSAGIALRGSRSVLLGSLALSALGCAALVTGVRTWQTSYADRAWRFSERPVEVPGLPARPPRALTLHNRGACALYDGRTAYCWGENLGRFLGKEDRPFGGRLIRGGPEMRDLALGGTSACAIDPQDRVHCWIGEYWAVNPQQQRLERSHLHRPGRPRVIQGPGPVAHVVLQEDTAYAVARDGALWSWRLKWEEPSPARVAGVSDAASVAASSEWLCVLGRTGRVACRREKESGPGPLRPVELAGPAQAIAVGGPTAYAVLADGSVASWGEAPSVHPGAAPAEAAGPLKARRLSVGEQPVTGVAAGYEFACAMLRSGGVWCWGDGGIYAEGPSAPPGPHPPAPVPGLAGVVQLAASFRSVCAQRRDGAVACWGG